MRIFTHRLIYRIAFTLVNVLVLLWLPAKGRLPKQEKRKRIFSLLPFKISTYLFNLTNNSNSVANAYTGMMKTVFFGFMFLFLLSAGQVIAQSQIYTTNGTFTAPAGVTSVQVECWGGGGAGGGYNQSNGTGGGGGGGAYVLASGVLVFPGITYNIIVGTGGVPGNSNGAASSAALFTPTSANGGFGGTFATNGVGGAGGTGGTHNGGKGSNGSNGNFGGGGGGSGGTLLVGNSVTNSATGATAVTGGGPGGNGKSGTVSGNGSPPASGPGGGGGGCRAGGSSRNGGSGFSGKVIISWTCPTYDLTATSATPVCMGDASTVTLTSSVTGLPVGTYTVTYNLSGSNIATVSKALNVTTAGTATFNTSVLANPGTTTITITNLASGTCSSNISSFNSVSIVVSSLTSTSPITPSTPDVCQNSTQNYLVNPPPPPGVIYTWVGPPGSNILSGQGTEFIVIRYGNTSGTLTITPSNICGNGLPKSMDINIIISTPAIPGPINGLVAPCIGTSHIYSVPLVNGVYYSWTVPAGWSAPVQGTNTITTVVGASAGDIVVIAGNACGGSASRLLAVVPQGAVPAQPSAITGNMQVCIGSTQTYSVNNVAFVTYTWSVPVDWTINSGQGTNTISVAIGPTSGNISVTPSNLCGTGTPRTMAVSIDAAVPADPGPIVGNNNPCESSAQVYSVTAQAGVSFAWTITGGNTITSGQGTNSITVAIGANPGTLTVSPSNACGTGPVKSMPITVIPLPASSGAITGSTLFCEGTSQTYSVVNVPGYTYNWTVPAGWTITIGQGTNAITVTTGVNSGNVKVTPENLCGFGPVSTLAITVNPLPAAFVGNDKVICTGASVQIGGPAVPGNTYSWTSLPAGFTSNISNPTVTPLATTIYYLVETNPVTGCSNLNNMTVTADQIIVVSATPASPVICSGSATNIVLSSNISGTLFSWTATLLTGTGTTFNTNGAGNVISEVITNTSSLPSEVTYTITATASVCVNASTTVVVTINPSPLVTGQTLSICSDSPSGITLGTSTNGVPVVSYNITNINNNGLLASAGSPSTGNGLAANVIADDAWTNTTTSPVNVVYTIAPISALGCAGNPFTITVTINPKPTVSSPVTYGICSGSATSINLTATLSSTFSWTIGTITGGITGASAGAGAVIAQTLTNPGNSAEGTVAYIVTPISVTGSCPGAPTTVLVTVHPKPAVTNAATTAICSGTTLNIPLTATVSSNFTWTIGTITGAITGAASGSGAIINQVLTNPGNAAAGSVEYLVTPTSQGSLCVGSPYIITVTVNPIPAVTASSSVGSVCDGITFSLFSSSPISNPTISWTSVPIGFTSAVQNPVNVSQVGPTIYTVSYTNTITGCSNSASVTVTSKPAPIAAISPDYCAVPGKIRLTATGGGTYLWSTGQTTQAIDVDIVGSYSVTVTGVNGCSSVANLSVSIELVTNGNFSNGNTSFTSGYVYDPGPNGLYAPESEYAVNNNAQYNHSNFWGYDHTSGTGVGNAKFMIVNGAKFSPQPFVWREIITVTPNTNYYFSAWAISMNNVPPYARLRFEVNGVQVGTTAILTSGLNIVNNPWLPKDRFYGTWNSGAATSATIRIIDIETSANGNDFGLDDISFGTLSAVPFTFNPSGNGGTNLVCEGQTLQLNANIVGGIAPYYFNWSGPNLFTSTLQDPIINNIPLSGQGTYTLSMYDSYGCTPQEKTVIITVNPAPTATVIGGDNVCQYGALPIITFTANGGIPTYTFTYNINGGANQTITTFGASNTAMIFAPTNTLGTFIYNLVSVIDGKGCTRAINTSTTVVVTPLPISAISGNNPVCSGSTGNIFTGNSDMDTYAWTIAGDGSIVGSNSNMSVDITAGIICGNYFTLTLVVNNSIGCSATSQESILVDDNFPPIITNCPPAIDYIGTNVSVISPLPYSATTVTITAAQFNTEGGLATDNCAIGTYTYSDAQSGTSPIIVDRTFTVTDKCGNPATCIQIITIWVPPDITCNDPSPVNTDAGLCTALLNPPEPTVNAGAPVTWSWVMSGATIASGTGAIGNYTFNVGVTTITWTATNIYGTDECAQLITVLDNQPPTFTPPSAKSYCVNNIIIAIFDGVADINPYRPDYYIFKTGDPMLDISGINDNCCALADLVIHWRIDFTPTPNPVPPHILVNTPSVSGTGQPSAYIGDIQFPGDGVYFLNVTHKILYWIEDCHNDTSAITTVDIIIKPRPNVIKM